MFTNVNVKNKETLKALNLFDKPEKKLDSVQRTQRYVDIFYRSSIFYYEVNGHGLSFELQLNRMIIKWK